MTPEQLEAIEEVRKASGELMVKLMDAQRAAEDKMEDIITSASRREIDTLKELIQVCRQQTDEIKRLGRR